MRTARLSFRGGSLRLAVEARRELARSYLRVESGELSFVLWLERDEVVALARLLTRAAERTPRAPKPCMTDGCHREARPPEVHCATCRVRMARAVRRAGKMKTKTKTKKGRR